MAESSPPASKFGLSTDVMSPGNRGKSDSWVQLAVPPPACVLLRVHSAFSSPAVGNSASPLPSQDRAAAESPSRCSLRLRQAAAPGPEGSAGQAEDAEQQGAGPFLTYLLFQQLPDLHQHPVGFSHLLQHFWPNITS